MAGCGRLDLWGHRGANPLPEPLRDRPRPRHSDALNRENAIRTGETSTRTSFGTKRSWVQIPPPRQTKHQVRGLIRLAGRASEWFRGSFGEPSAEERASKRRTRAQLATSKGTAVTHRRRASLVGPVLRRRHPSTNTPADHQAQMEHHRRIPKGRRGLEGSPRQRSWLCTSWDTSPPPRGVFHPCRDRSSPKRIDPEDK